MLVHAGAGGVGTAAIQLAKAAGAKVIATAGGARKTEVCTRARRRPRHRLHHRGLRPDRQGGHRRPRRRHRLRPGRRRRLRQVAQVHRLRGPAGRRRLHQRPHPRGAGQPPAGEELQRRRPALGALPQARPGDLRHGARGADPARRGGRTSTRWSARRCRSTRRPQALKSLADREHRRQGRARPLSSRPLPPGRTCGPTAPGAPGCAASPRRSPGRPTSRSTSPPARPARTWRDDVRCGIHAQLRERGFPGCDGVRLLRRRPAAHPGHLRRRVWRTAPELAGADVRRPAGDAPAARAALVPHRGAHPARGPSLTPRCGAAEPTVGCAAPVAGRAGRARRRRAQPGGRGAAGPGQRAGARRRAPPAPDRRRRRPHGRAASRRRPARRHPARRLPHRRRPARRRPAGRRPAGRRPARRRPARRRPDRLPVPHPAAAGRRRGDATTVVPRRAASTGSRWSRSERNRHPSDSGQWACGRPRRAVVSATSMPCSRSRFSPRIFRLATSVSCG